MKQNPQTRSLKVRLIAWSFASLLGMGIWVNSSLNPGLTQTPQTAQVVRIRVQDIWRQVYEQLPNLPQENHYISQETGEVAENDTLVGRFIRYHVYIKGRSPQFRLDWKLTVADYLGVNEVMSENRYPSGNALNENPMLSDRQAMSNLSRSERNALVNTIVDLFNPNLPQHNSSQSVPPRSEPNSPQQPSPRTTPLPPQPQPGDAELLR